MSAYVDTSVLVAYYLPERKSSRIQKVLSELDSPVISPLVEVEFCSALSRKVRMKELSKETARQVLGLFQVHLADRLYDRVSITRREFDLACEWLGDFSCGLRTLDALHLAAAFAHDLTLLTADTVLATAARSVGAPVEKV